MGTMAEQNRDRAARRRLHTPKCYACRKPLRKYMHRWWSRIPDGPMPVASCMAEHGRVLEVRPARCDSPVERVLDYWCGEWGYGGNNYFCSVRCGYAWAVRELEARG